MRGQHTFGAARHHEGDLLRHFGWRRIKIGRQHGAPHLRRILTREVIDTAIALGLAHHSDDICRVDFPGVDQCLNLRQIAGTAAQYLVYPYGLHDQLRYPLRCSSTLSSTRQAASSSARETDSFGACPCSPSPGPKLTICTFWPLK